MKNFTLIACLTLGLISCSNTGYEKKIPGSWCEPIPGRAQDVQGIKFQKDGKARSTMPGLPKCPSGMSRNRAKTPDGSRRCDWS